MEANIRKGATRVTPIVGIRYREQAVPAIVYFK